MANKTKKPAARAATKKAAQKKSPARKAAAKPTARRKLKSKGRAPAPRREAGASETARRHQPSSRRRFQGRRPARLCAYRDLGIADATHGLARAHVIRLIGPCNPDEVSKLHYHDVDFQMVYVLKGWVKSYMDGVGETRSRSAAPGPSRPRSST